MNQNHLLCNAEKSLVIIIILYKHWQYVVYNHPEYSVYNPPTPCENPLFDWQNLPSVCVKPGYLLCKECSLRTCIHDKDERQAMFFSSCNYRSAIINYRAFRWSSVFWQVSDSTWITQIFSCLATCWWSLNT